MQRGARVGGGRAEGNHMGSNQNGSQGQQGAGEKHHLGDQPLELSAFDHGTTTLPNVPRTCAITVTGPGSVCPDTGRCSTPSTSGPDAVSRSPAGSVTVTSAIVPSGTYAPPARSTGPTDTSMLSAPRTAVTGTVATADANSTVSVVVVTLPRH